MKILILLFGISILNINCINAQRNDNVWIFGYHMGQFNDLPGLNFYYDKPDTFSCTSTIEFGASCNQISDLQGNLMLISNGTSIVNWSYEKVFNSDNYNSGDYLDLYNAHPFRHAEIILPKPKSPNIFSIFSLGLVEGNFSTWYSRELRYSEIDMNQNSGLGAMTIKKEFVLNKDSIVFNSLAACLHSNSKDWWIINKTIGTNRFSIVKLKSTGPQLIKYQYTGPISVAYACGGSLFTSDCKYYCSINENGNISLYNFNNTTGDLNYYLQLKINSAIDSNYNFAKSISISDNGKMLYATNYIEVHQYNLVDSNIQSSELIVANYDGFVDYNPTVFGCTQLAPNNKIYINSNGTRYLSVINSPDSLGTKCNVTQHSVKLTSYSDDVLPFFPYFKHTSTIEEWEPEPNTEFIIYPIPCSTILTINNPTEQILSYKLFDIYGRLLVFESVNANKFDIITNQLNSGIYLIELQTETKKIVRKFSKI